MAMKSQNIIGQNGKSFSQCARSWFRNQFAQATHCRECDTIVGFSETVCPRCGASNPVRISKSTVTLILGLVVCLAGTMLIYVS